MAHFIGYSRADNVSRVFSHCQRKKNEDGTYIRMGNELINQDRTALNYNLAPMHDAGQYGFMQERLNDVKIQNRKDVKIACFWTITAPSDLKPGEIKPFFEQAYSFMEKRYNLTGKIVSAYVHMDETRPHMHFGFLPIVANKNGGEKICKSDLVNQRELNNFHPAISAHMSSFFGRDIEVINGATAKGNKSIKELKAQSAIETIEQKLAHYKDMLQTLVDEKLAIPEPKMAESVGSYYKRIKPLRDQFIALELNLKSALAENVDLKKENGALYEDVRALKEVASRARFENNQYWNRIIENMKAEKLAREDILRSFEKPLSELLPIVAEKVRDGLENATSEAALLTYLQKYNLHMEFKKEGDLCLICDNQKNAISVGSIDEKLAPQMIAQRIVENQKRFLKERPFKNAEKILSICQNIKITLQPTPEILKLEKELVNSQQLALAKKTEESVANLISATDELIIFLFAEEAYQNLVKLRCEVNNVIVDTQELSIQLPQEKFHAYLERTQAARATCKEKMEHVQETWSSLREQQRVDKNEMRVMDALLRKLQPLKHNLWEHLNCDTYKQLFEQYQQQRAIMDSLRLLNLFLVSQSDEPEQQRASIGELSAAALKELARKNENQRN